MSRQYIPKVVTANDLRQKVHEVLAARPSKSVP